MTAIQKLNDQMSMQFFKNWSNCLNYAVSGCISSPSYNIMQDHKTQLQFNIKFDLPEYGLLARPSLPGIAAAVPGNVTP